MKKIKLTALAKVTGGQQASKIPGNAMLDNGNGTLQPMQCMAAKGADGQPQTVKTPDGGSAPVYGCYALGSQIGPQK